MWNVKQVIWTHSIPFMYDGNSKGVYPEFKRSNCIGDSIKPISLKNNLTDYLQLNTILSDYTKL